MSFNLCYSWPSIHSTGCFISVFTFCRHFGITRCWQHYRRCSQRSYVPTVTFYTLLSERSIWTNGSIRDVSRLKRAWFMYIGEYCTLQAIRTVRSVTQRPWR